MIRVGITGNIGSGKTTVAQIFETLGIPVYYADKEAKNLYSVYPEVKTQVIQLLGQPSYNPDGSPDFAFIKHQVFNHPDKLAALNSILHPYVFKNFDDWCEQQALTANTPYVLKEAAILFESGADKTVNKTILVSAPEHIKVQRAMLRDGVSQTEIQKRLTNQFSEEKLQKLVDFVVINDGEHPLIPQVLAIHQQLVAENNPQ